MLVLLKALSIRQTREKGNGWGKNEKTGKNMCVAPTNLVGDGALDVP
jgi:hypothetical protein